MSRWQCSHMIPLACSSVLSSITSLSVHVKPCRTSMRHLALWCCRSLLSCVELKQMFAAGFSGSKPSVISHTQKNNRRQIVLAKSPLPQTSLAVMNSHLAKEVLQCQSRRGSRKNLWLPKAETMISVRKRHQRAAFNCQFLKCTRKHSLMCVEKLQCFFALVLTGLRFRQLVNNVSRNI